MESKWVKIGQRSIDLNKVREMNHWRDGSMQLVFGTKEVVELTVEEGQVLDAYLDWSGLREDLNDWAKRNMTADA